MRRVTAWGKCQLIIIQQGCLIYMQEVSQGSLKLQAHHDKVGNDCSQSTKALFLEDEIYFLSELKESVQRLQQLARPTQQIQMQRLAKYMGGMREELEEEVVRTRRQTALLELAPTIRFEEAVTQHYAESADVLASRLQIVEDLVQHQEFFKKKNSQATRQSHLSFGKLEQKGTFEGTIKIRTAVQQLLLKRLLIAGKIKERRQVLPLVVAKQRQLKYREYHFLSSQKQFYRSKSNDTLFKSSTSGLKKPIECNKKIEGMLEIEIKPTRRDQGTKLPYSMLKQFEASIFQEAVDGLKSENSKLQSKIDMIKTALQLRENRQTLLTLNASKKLDQDQSKARQVLAFLGCNQSLSNKIQACSYLWAAQKCSTAQHQGKASEENFEAQRRLSKRNKLYHKIRSRSANRLSNSQIELKPPEPELILNKQTKLASKSREKTKKFKMNEYSIPFKSNEKTNCSLQNYERPL